MNKKLYWWQFGGFVFVSLFGTLLHFLYDWTGEFIAVAPFSAVNESTFEHMKIFFIPAFVYALIEHRFFGFTYSGFWSIKLIGSIVGTLFIPFVFYTLVGAFGMSPDWANILIFFLSGASCYLLETHLFLTRAPVVSEKIALFILIAITLLFFLFTFLPPRIPLFQDPVSGSFGV